MKSGMSLENLAAEILRREEAKKDFLANTSKLDFIPQDSDIVLSLGESGTYGMEDTMHDQLSAKLQIPKPYYNRMRLEYPELLAQNLNGWAHKNKTNQLIRTLDGKARAFLSDRYRPLDYGPMISNSLPILSGHDLDIESAAITEKKIYLKAFSKKLEGEVKVGQTVRWGIVMGNSDIGYGSLFVAGMVLTLQCLNGMIRERTINQKHVGRRNEDFGDVSEYFSDKTRMLEDFTFMSKFKDAVAGLLSEHNFNSELGKMRNAAQSTPVTDAIGTVMLVQKKHSFTDHETGSLLRYLSSGGDYTKWGVSSAITRLSQDIESYERATELEVLGGQIIDLPESQWKTFVEAKA